MQITSTYNLPFDSEYDWRVTLFQMIHDLTVEAAKEVLPKIREDSQDFDWEDELGILEFALQENIFVEINKVVLRKAAKFVSE